MPFNAFFKHPLLCCLNWWKNHLGPQHLLLFEKCCLKWWPLFRRAPYPKDTSGVARRGMCPFLFVGLKGGAAVPLSPRKFGLERGLKWPSIAIHWEVAAIGNLFDGKNQRKLVIFGNFEMSPRCLGNRKCKTEHVITNSIFVPIFNKSHVNMAIPRRMCLLIGRMYM
jgi:hypothetical protein